MTATRKDKDMVASPSQTVGPFFHFCLTTDATLGQLAGPDARGERIRLSVRVLDGAGDPVPDAMVEIWQADADGVYQAPPRRDEALPRPPFVGYGRLPTSDQGVCTFETVRPGRTSDEQAAHINVCLFARGLLRQLHTRLYFDGDPDLSGDPALAAVPESRRSTLVAREADEGHWVFDLHLQGDHETVFFDL